MKSYTVFYKEKEVRFKEYTYSTDTGYEDSESLNEGS